MNKKNLHFIFRSFNVFRRVSGFFLVPIIGLKLIISLLPFGIVIFERQFFSQLNLLPQSTMHSLIRAFLYIVLLNILSSLCQYFFDIVWNKGANKNQLYYVELLERNINTKVAFFETERPCFNMQLRMANNAGYLHDMIGIAAIDFFTTLIGFFFLGAYMGSLKPVFFLFIVLTALPIIIEKFITEPLRRKPLRKLSILNGLKKNTLRI